jgi:hypothetical protein
VHSGQRRAATGMLIVHWGQSRVVAALKTRFPRMMRFLKLVVRIKFLGSAS